MSGSDDALADLQTRVAYQEDTLEQLNQVVTGQAARIARLESALERLARRLADATAPPEPGEQGSERPPHY